MFDPPPHPQSPPRAVLFDVDGTLVDTNDLHAACWRETLAAFGHDIATETIREQIGKGADNLIPALLGDVAEAESAALAEAQSERFKRDYLPRSTPFPGVRDLFERLAADGIRIVLASSAGAEEVAFHLSLIGCADLVFATTSRDEVESSKPCPDIFAAALAKVAPLGAADAIVVGDTPWDVLAANRAGLRTIGFRCGGFAEADLIDAGAVMLFDGPRDLLDSYALSPFAGRRIER